MTNLNVLRTSSIDCYDLEISDRNRTLALNLYQGSISHSSCRINWEVENSSIQRKGFSNPISIFDAAIYEDTFRCRTRNNRLRSKDLTSKPIRKVREKPKTYSPGQHLVLTLVRIMNSTEHLDYNSAKLRVQAFAMLRDTVTLYLGTIVNIESAWKQLDSVLLTEDGSLKEPFARGICTRFPIHTKYFARFLDALTADLIRHLSLGGELAFAHGKITADQIGDYKELILRKTVPEKNPPSQSLRKNNAKLLKIEGFTFL